MKELSHFHSTLILKTTQEQQTETSFTFSEAKRHVKSTLKTIKAWVGQRKGK
jgi:hypothetical protein